MSVRSRLSSAGASLAFATQQPVDDTEGDVESERRDGVSLERGHVDDDDDGRACPIWLTYSS